MYIEYDMNEKGRSWNLLPPHPPHKEFYLKVSKLLGLCDICGINNTFQNKFKTFIRIIEVKAFFVG